LGAANITVNKNAVPNDPMSPFVTSGIRVGTPAITTRGFKVAECAQLAHWMCDIIDTCDQENKSWDRAVEADVKQKVLDLCGRFPVYR